MVVYCEGDGGLEGFLNKLLIFVFVISIVFSSADAVYILDEQLEVSARSSETISLEVFNDGPESFFNLRIPDEKYSNVMLPEDPFQLQISEESSEFIFLTLDIPVGIHEIPLIIETLSADPDDYTVNDIYNVSLIVYVSPYNGLSYSFEDESFIEYERDYYDYRYNDLDVSLETLDAAGLDYEKPNVAVEGIKNFGNDVVTFTGKIFGTEEPIESEIKLEEKSPKSSTSVLIILAAFCVAGVLIYMGLRMKKKKGKGGDGTLPYGFELRRAVS